MMSSHKLKQVLPSEAKRSLTPRKTHLTTTAQKNLVGMVQASPSHELSRSSDIQGQGVYLISYRGAHPAYKLIANANSVTEGTFPIYIGKAWASNRHRRKKVGAERTGRHRRSINLVRDLNLDDFEVRFISLPWGKVETVEQSLIEVYFPLWNYVLLGFGNKHPGKGREGQHRSPFDTFHPGRTFAEKLTANIQSADLQKLVNNHLAIWLETVVRVIDPHAYQALLPVDES